MGIRLDWDVESDSGHEAVEEDAQIVAAQKRRAKRLRIGLIIGALLLMVSAGILYWRARNVYQERERTLIATVEAESLALRLGDKDKFMRFQGPAESWRNQQRK